MTPMNPKSESPMNTPKIVTSGCVSASFFCITKRTTLSTCVTTSPPYSVSPTAGPHSPARAMYPASGSQTSAVPKIGMIVAKQVSTPQNSGLGAPKIR